MVNIAYSIGIIVLAILIFWLSVQIFWTKKLIELLIKHSDISEEELAEYALRFP